MLNWSRPMADDRWLSVAETFEFLPAEEWASRPSDDAACRYLAMLWVSWAMDMTAVLTPG